MLRYTVEGAMLKHKMADLCSLAFLFGGKILFWKGSKQHLRLPTKDGRCRRGLVLHFTWFPDGQPCEFAE